MSVTIGHASIDERGKASGGRAGDQTGREVCTRGWYNKGWRYCLRPKSASVAERMAKACEQGCANNKIGYDQSQRNSLHYYAKRCGYNLAIINTKCETDCSAFMTVCALAGRYLRTGVQRQCTHHQYDGGQVPCDRRVYRADGQ